MRAQRQTKHLIDETAPFDYALSNCEAVQNNRIDPYPVKSGIVHLLSSAAAVYCSGQLTG